MPAGFTNPTLGYAGFCIVKLAGCSLAAHYISRSYGRTDISAWRVGGLRTLVRHGRRRRLFPVVDGGGNNVHFPKLTSPNVPYLYLVGLLPVRIAEWWLLIWMFYDRGLNQRAKGWRTVGMGTTWSYVLDAPAIAGFFATAGFWIC